MNQNVEERCHQQTTNDDKCEPPGGARGIRLYYEQLKNTGLSFVHLKNSVLPQTDTQGTLNPPTDGKRKLISQETQI